MRISNALTQVAIWLRREPGALRRFSRRFQQPTIFSLFLLLTFVLAASSGAFAQDQSPAPQSSDSASPPPSSQSDNSGASAASPTIHHARSSRSSYDDHLSQGLNDFLHGHHLPFVDAMVFSNSSGNPTLVKLSGRVRTEHGKEDAATKSSDFLNQPGIRIQNRIDVDAALETAAGSPAPAAAAPSPSGDAMAGTGGTSAAANDPCSNLCYKDEGHCKTGCSSQAAGGASGGGWQQMLGQVSQSATQMNQCTDQCVQTREHCVYDCQQNGNAAPESGAGGPASEESSAHGEGPNTPPE
jgi:hypothetical protein